jgi:hypothetical protein
MSKNKRQRQREILKAKPGRTMFPFYAPRINFTNTIEAVYSGAREQHINMIVNIEKKGTYKNLHKNQEENENEEQGELEIDQNYDITTIKEVRLKIGRNKGEKVLKEVVINPPKKRYKILATK